MLHLYDCAMIDQELILNLDQDIARLLTERIRTLKASEFDLLDSTEFVFVSRSDSEKDILDTIGLSPLVNPIDQSHISNDAFTPYWDYILFRDNYIELSISFGSTFAYIIFIQERSDDLWFTLKRYCIQTQ